VSFQRFMTVFIQITNQEHHQLSLIEGAIRVQRIQDNSRYSALYQTEAEVNIPAGQDFKFKVIYPLMI
jgi:hypothetical protein